jgi:hypothetical protein
VGRGAQVRWLSGGDVGARGHIPMPSEPPLAAETGHERHADMPNQHLRWNSVTWRPLAPPRPDWPILASPVLPLRAGVAPHRLVERSAEPRRGSSSPSPACPGVPRGAHFHPAFRGAFRRSPSSSRGKVGQRAWLHRGNG